MRIISASRSAYPSLNDRALGWLDFLYQKATTPDDWSEDGEPHEWWDRSSTRPMCSFPRFDLQESTYAIGLMADQTPAWREVYAEILNELTERYLTYWAAVDWLSQFGIDPKRKDYPLKWKGTLIPEEFWGDYDTPGWVANGIEPWGLQPDPIGADGNLFFKGWLNLTQALHAYVTGEDKWGDPFHVAGVDRSRFEWTQHRVVDHLCNQWQRTPMGPHCENTKTWPFCLSAAGLGLKLYDAVFKKQAHQVVDEWLERSAKTFYDFDSTGALRSIALYYDPLKDHAHMMNPAAGLAVGFYLLPQYPDFARQLYKGAVTFLKWNDPSCPIVPLNDPRTAAIGLVMAKEVGDYVTEARLRSYAEATFEPRHFGMHDSQFGYWFGLSEKWPRGQLSALAICADVGEKGGWERLFRQPNLSKFNAPSIEGVDFPALGVAQAWNDEETGVLFVRTTDGNRTKGGNQTNFKVVNLPDIDVVKVLRNGAEYSNWSRANGTEIEIRTTIGAYNFQIYTSYIGQRTTSHEKSKIATPNFKPSVRRPISNSIQAAGGAARPIISAKPSCPCCVAVLGVSAAL